MKEQGVYTRLLDFLEELDDKNIAYTLLHFRSESVAVLIRTPSDRWEVEFMDDGSVEVERFIDTGEVRGEGAFGEMLDPTGDSFTDPWARLADDEQESSDR